MLQNPICDELTPEDGLTGQSATAHGDLGLRVCVSARLPPSVIVAAAGVAAPCCPCTSPGCRSSALPLLPVDLLMASPLEHLNSMMKLGFWKSKFWFGNGIFVRKFSQKFEMYRTDLSNHGNEI